MTNFRKLKIAINDQQPLDEVVKELERLGYKKWRWGGFIDERFNDCSIRALDNGKFTDMKSKQVYSYGYKETTLAELKEM